MSKVKVEILRDVVISAKVSAKAGNIVEVGEDEARNLFIACAAKPAAEEATKKTAKKAK